MKIKFNKIVASVRARSVAAVAVVGSAVLSVAAHAQSADPFDAAVTSLTTKVSGYGLGMFALAAVSVGFVVGIKYLKKLPKAA